MAAMDDFVGFMREHQGGWREEHCGDIDPGTHRGRPYNWIVPAEDWERGLWDGIRSGSSRSVQDHVNARNIQIHEGKNNLNSSWILCANLYFPFDESDAGRSLFASFLASHGLPEIRTIESIDLEYAEPAPLSPKDLLGEKDGRRGAGQTSPDLGLVANGGRALVLIESKLTEDSFYPCSARKSKGTGKRSRNPDPARCLSLPGILRDPTGSCHQTVWKRRYWEILRPAFNMEAVDGLRCCPAALAGYQLFRQQALAEAFANSGKYDSVASAVAYDARNTKLVGSLAASGIDDVRHWGRLFKGKARFTAFTHQDWVSWVREHDHDATWSDWLHYVERRYAFQP